MEMSQKLIPGTSRSVLVYKSNNDAYTVEIHSIQDMMMVNDYAGISELFVNVGFAASTFFHGPQPEETPDDWRQAILNILQIWRPQLGLSIRTWNSDNLRKALTYSFITDLQTETGFDVFIDDGNLWFLRMYVLQEN